MDVYQLISSATSFDWDEGNAEKSWTKHRVSHAECEQVFFNQPLLVAHDIHHFASEPRFNALGESTVARALFIAFTLRGSVIRVVSARDVHRKEREVYRDA